MTKLAALLAAVRSEIGYTECPRDGSGRCLFTGHTGPGDNHTKFAAEAHLANGTYWCAVGTSALLIREKVRVPKGVLTASTRANKAAWQAAGRWIEPADIEAGDIVFDHLTGRNGKNHNVPDHTAIAFGGPHSGRLPTVEFNTSSDDHGSQDNGGGVFPKNRSLSVVIGAGRPYYDDDDLPPDPEPPSPQEDEMKLLHVVEGPDKDSIWLQRGNQLLLMRPDGHPAGSGDTQQARNSGVVVGDIEEPLWSYLKANSDIVLP